MKNLLWQKKVQQDLYSEGLLVEDWREIHGKDLGKGGKIVKRGRGRRTALLQKPIKCGH